MLFNDKIPGQGGNQESWASSRGFASDFPYDLVQVTALSGLTLSLSVK